MFDLFIYLKFISYTKYMWRNKKRKNI